MYNHWLIIKYILFLQDAGVQKNDSTNIKFTKEHYQDIISFKQFTKIFRPIFLTINNVTPLNVHKLLDTKWHEFCRNNPFLESDISESDCSSNKDFPKQKTKRIARLSSEGENSIDEPKSRRISKRFKTNEISDEEFEKALITSSESSDSDPDNGMTKARKKNFKKKGIIHNKLCVKCQRGGKKLFCQKCPNAYHSDCLDSSTTSKSGIWLCPRCIDLKNYKLRLLCAKCGGSEGLIKCQTCKLAFHSSCMFFPLVEKIDTNSWSCHICTCPPMINNPSRIMSWRWKDASRKFRQFFVKYHDKSFYECSWVDELQLKVYSKLLLLSYSHKNDMEHPPIFEYELDVQDDRYKRLLQMGYPSGEERAHFENKFYKFGIEPEWLIVHRIIADEIINDGTKKYLVKWRELGYRFCTWELETSKYILEFRKEIKFYEKMKHFHLANQNGNAMKSNTHIKSEEPEKMFFIPPKTPITNLKIKLDENDYIGSSEFKLHPYQLEGELVNGIVLDYCY